MKLKFLPLACVFACALAMSACQSASAPAPETPTVMGWSPVASWSGRANYQTDSFNIATGQWRIKWQASASSASQSASPGEKYFRIIVHSSVSGRFVNVAVDHQGAGQGIAYVYEDPRDFFLAVESSGVDWKMSVEQGVPGQAEK